MNKLEKEISALKEFEQVIKQALRDFATARMIDGLDIDMISNNAHSQLSKAYKEYKKAVEIKKTTKKPDGTRMRVLIVYPDWMLCRKEYTLWCLSLGEQMEGIVRCYAATSKITTPYATMTFLHEMPADTNAYNEVITWASEEDNERILQIARGED